MNRRLFLKFAVLTPVVPILAVEALSKNPVVLVNHNTPGIDPNILMPNYAIQNKWEHTFTWNDDLVNCLTRKDGIHSFWIRAQGQEKLERIVVNDVDVERAEQGGTGRFWYANPTIRIDHECHCRDL